MSLLPQQIPPQTEPLATVDEKTGNLIISVNWWLYLFNIGKQVLSGPTAPIPVTPGGALALFDTESDDVTAPLPREVLNALVLASDNLLPDRGPPGPAGSSGMPGLDGDPGEDGTIGPPGATGAAGAAGSPGAAGSQGPIGFALDGEDGLEPMMIPGTQGPAGAAGATGSTGPTGPAGTPAILLLEGDQGEEGFAGAPAVVGSGGFLSFDSHPASPNAANDEFELPVLATQWSVQTNTASVVKFSSYCPGAIWIQLSTSTTSEYCISEAFVPGSADFSVTFKAYLSPVANFTLVGFQIADNAHNLLDTPGTSTGYDLALVISTASTAIITANKWVAGANTAGSNTTIAFAPETQIYLHIQRVGGTYTMWYSINGVAFYQYTGLTLNAAPTVGFITLFAMNNGSSNAHFYAAFDWVRVNQLFL